MLVLVAAWLPASLSVGADLYVDPTLAEATCDTYAPVTRTCGTGSDRAIRTLAPLADPGTTMPGDQVLLRGAVYTETLVVGNSGTESDPIVYTAHGSETPVITGGLDPGISLAAVSHVVLRRITVEDVVGWARIEDCSELVIEDCTFSNATAPGSRASVKVINSHRNIIRRNTFDVGNDNLQLIHSDFNLVEDNRITSARHNLWSILCGNGNLIRRNFFSNDIQKAGQITDCEGSPSGATFSLNDTHRNVIEENEFALTASSGGSSPYAGIQHAAQETIIRRNVFHDTVGPALDLTLYAEEASTNIGVRVYHDDFVRSEFAGVSIAREGGETTFEDNQFKNNILSGSRFVANDTRWDWYVDVLAGEPVQLLASRLSGFTFDHNNFYGSAAGQDHVITNGYRARNDNPPGQSVADWQLAEPAVFVDNLEASPGFVDGAGNDFQLLEGSAMIDEGAFLTQAAADGSGTLLVVDDASWFFEGLGFGGSLGDEIQLEGATERARIISIDLATNTLVVDRVLNWSAGQGVTLPYEGAAPDVGAHEYVPSACDPPDGLPDADGDGVRDECDCARDDMGSSGVPAPPLLFLTSLSDLSWLADAAQPSATIGVHRGELNALRASAQVLLSCVESGVPGRSAVDETQAMAGQPLYYLLEASTCFGGSGLGEDSVGEARVNVGAACP